MERIQSAIEKARQRRVGTLPDPAPRGPAPAAPQATPDRVQQAWQALEEYTPDPAVMKRSRILTYAGGPDAAPFDMMRTKVLQQMRANGWRRLAITSPGKACGKTTVSANLAFGIARQPEMRLALIEMDMRRPALAQALGIGSGPQQISRVFEGKDPLSRQLLRFGTNLALGVNHAVVANTSELLHSPAVPDVLAAMEADLGLTLMLFDTPPMLAADDMLAFVSKVDCVLLVAAAESTSIAEIDRCERELSEQTNVLGVVLNKCRYTEPSYGYGYGY
ncbi:CpsD/CapB family tyrosine-protein kinase [Rhodobacter sp. Har01]|uniref:CpsD/CapB family tyrosine-protein kinase n=1 Tax=Rhodobacter sp. Har01 TaxID=2883999 RepID=UPI001D0631C4|nr:CpsD/CapB family tyrosine-protein kinase [Rhodobacter sp. Har01]MCB6180105.1 CpsD/CapB family tyrosine-protein kinase [Rhodobacter sp. Har01]